MKQKRTYLTLLLVVALLVLGIAYAAITADTLTITGSAAAALDDENFVVRFAKTGDVYTEPTTSGDNKALVTEAKVTNDTTASFKIEGLTTKGQTATITYTIENASPADVDADVAVKLVNANETWYTATVNPATTIDLKKDKTATVAITVTLKDTPATDAEVAAAKGNFTVTLTADAK